MIPKILHCVWVGDEPLPRIARDCVESWRRHCPGWEIRQWGNDFAKTVENRYVQEAFAHRKWAFVSDWIRLYALVKQGGFYLDTDMEMERPFDGFLNERFVISWERMNGRTNFNCGVIGCEPGNEVAVGLLGLYDDLPFVKADGEFDQTPNTVRFIDYFDSTWNVRPSDDGMDTVRFGNGGVVLPWTYFLPGGGYTRHLYTASWLDAWLRKVWLKVGPYKIVRFKRRKEASAPDFTLQDGERSVFSLPLGRRKRVALVRSAGGAAHDA